MAAAEHSQRRGQALRVLVVDSQLSRKATVSLLESCDYTVRLRGPYRGQSGGSALTASEGPEPLRDRLTAGRSGLDGEGGVRGAEG